MERMPVVFIGHGSPMNAIEDNKYTKEWQEIAECIPKPKAILVVSAHWFTKGTKILDAANPKMTYDMYGFPQGLYDIVYDCGGAPELAHTTKSLINKETEIDNSWGYDHGAWSVLVKMYPNRDIPVFQLSVDKNLPAEEHFEIGRQIKSLREQGVLILASGNVVHNLRIINWDMEGGYDWAYEFDHYIKDNILSRKYENVIDYHKIGNSANLSVPTTDHYYPLLYALGASDEQDKITVYSDDCLMGSMSMTSYLFH